MAEDVKLFVDGSWHAHQEACLLADLVAHVAEKNVNLQPRLGTVSDMMAGCEPSWRHLAQFGFPFGAAGACDGAASRIGTADCPIVLTRRFTYLGNRLDPDIRIGCGHRRQ